MLGDICLGKRVHFIAYAIKQVIARHLSGNDLANVRQACRSFKDFSRDVEAWTFRVPTRHLEWEYATRGALYCVCPVSQHMTLVLSNRVEDQVRSMQPANINRSITALTIPGHRNVLTSGRPCTVQLHLLLATA